MREVVKTIIILGVINVGKLKDMKNKEENTILNMASCMLSIYDSLKLEDNNSRDKSESLTEVMFRKMEGYNIDLNELLNFTHLKPIQAKEEDKPKEVFTFGGKRVYTEEDVKFIATRFAHECRLNEVTTNNDTINLYDRWITNQ